MKHKDMIKKAVKRAIIKEHEPKKQYSRMNVDIPIVNIYNHINKRVHK